MSAHVAIDEDDGASADPKEGRNFEDVVNDLQAKVHVFKGRCAYFSNNGIPSINR